MIDALRWMVAVVYSHSSGDVAAAQELARRALEDSMKAAKQTEELAMEAAQHLKD